MLNILVANGLTASRRPNQGTGQLPDADLRVAAAAGQGLDGGRFDVEGMIMVGANYSPRTCAFLVTAGLPVGRYRTCKPQRTGS